MEDTGSARPNHLFGSGLLKHDRGRTYFRFNLVRQEEDPGVITYSSRAPGGYAQGTTSLLGIGEQYRLLLLLDPETATLSGTVGPVLSKWTRTSYANGGRVIFLTSTETREVQGFFFSEKPLSTRDLRYLYNETIPVPETGAPNPNPDPWLSAVFTAFESRDGRMVYRLLEASTERPGDLKPEDITEAFRLFIADTSEEVERSSYGSSLSQVRAVEGENEVRIYRGEFTYPKGSPLTFTMFLERKEDLWYLTRFVLPDQLGKTK